MTRNAAAKASKSKRTTKPTAKQATPRRSVGKRRANEVPPRVSAATKAAPTKRQQLADLLCRDEGATIDQMIAATGWLPHTVRAALTGLRKAGYRIDSDRVDGVRTWRAVAP